MVQVTTTIAKKLQTPTLSTIFITNVTPTASGVVDDKVYVADTNPASKVLESCTSDTDSVTVHIEVDGGSAGWQPTITITGGATDVVITNLTRLGSYSRRFSGSAAITVSSSTVLRAVADDGGKSEQLVYTRALDPPAILGIQWDDQGTNPDPYPAVQTQFKEGDYMQLSGTCETHAEEVYIKDSGATSGQGLQGPYAASGGSWTATNVLAGNASDATASVTAYAKVTGGSAGADFNSETDQTPATVDCDQTSPTFSSASIVYPSGQEALKDNEDSQVTITHTNAVAGDTYLYSDNGTGELEISNSQNGIADTTTYQATKWAERQSGNYRISGTNYRLTVTRTTKNGKSAYQNATVEIAHTSPTLTVNTYSSQDGTNASRLRTDAGSATDTWNGYLDHSIRLVSDQAVLSTATPSISGSAVGTWQGGGWSQQSVTEYRRDLRISGSDMQSGGQSNNNYDWDTDFTVTWTNRAGKVTTTVTTNNSFSVGGFGMRTITIPAWPNREADFGQIAVDLANKNDVDYLTNSPTAHTYRSSVGDETNKFTITNGSDVFDVDGQYLYNCDYNNASINLTGTATVEVEETP